MDPKDFPRQIIFEKPLWIFIEYCEIYCTGSCCGTKAFAILPALILRKVMDRNVTGYNGKAFFTRAREQIDGITKYVQLKNVQTVNGDVPIWDDGPGNLPQFWLPEEDLLPWLKAFQDAFQSASGFGGLGTKNP